MVSDLFDAQGVANTTPTFLVLSGGQGTLMRGSQASERKIKSK